MTDEIQKQRTRLKYAGLVLGITGLALIAVQIPKLSDNIRAYNKAKREVECNDAKQLFDYYKKRQSELYDVIKSTSNWHESLIEGKLSGAHWDGGSIPGECEREEFESCSREIKEIGEWMLKYCR